MMIILAALAASRAASTVIDTASAIEISRNCSINVEAENACSRSYRLEENVCELALPGLQTKGRDGLSNTRPKLSLGQAWRSLGSPSCQGHLIHFDASTNIGVPKFGKMAPRWKGKNAKATKDSEAEAHKEPMSKIISHLQSSQVQSDATGFLFGNSVRIVVGAEQTDLFVKVCFGPPVSTVEKDKQWFQLGLEEAFYLCYSLKCLKINGSGTSLQDEEELWHYMKSKKRTFPYFYKGYSHLRLKNWVVRPEAQYLVDFVVYCYHPALVHSEYGVLVLSDGDDNDCNRRLREWSDFHCTTRLLGSVAKSLLVLCISKNDINDGSPLCLAEYMVEERIITRWSPQQCREG